jgi:putative membrane protein
MWSTIPGTQRCVGVLFDHGAQSQLPDPPVIRLLISAALRLGANALGLLVADAILDDMSIEWKGFIVAVLIFTGVQVLIEPLMMKIALTSAPVLRGSVALVAVLIGLIVTDVFFDGVSISGFTTWALATVIVWLAAMLAAFILPLIFLRNQREDRKAAAAPQGSTWAP